MGLSGMLDEVGLERKLDRKQCCQGGWTSMIKIVVGGLVMELRTFENG